MLQKYRVPIINVDLPRVPETPVTSADFFESESQKVPDVSPAAEEQSSVSQSGVPRDSDGHDVSGTAEQQDSLAAGTEVNFADIKTVSRAEWMQQRQL